MQAGPAETGARQKRSLAVALLGYIGAAALVGVYMAQGGSHAPSLTGSLALPVFPLLEEAAALQVPVSNTPRMRESVDRRSAIAAGFAAVAASQGAPLAWAEEAAEAAEPAAEAAPAPKPKAAAKGGGPGGKGPVLSPYAKMDPNSFGGNTGGGPVVMGYPEVKPPKNFGIVDKNLSPFNEKGKPKVDYSTRLAKAPPPDLSKEDALALIKSSGARTFGDLAEGMQSGGGWQDHMEATRKQTERLYAEAAQRKAGM